MSASSASAAELDQCRRSSARIPLSIAVVLRGSDSAGKSFVEQTRTVVINRGGARLLTKQSLGMGAKLQLAIPHLKRVSWATVSWLGEKKSETQEVGVAVEETSDFWGVRFPEDKPDSQTAGQNPEISSANAFMAEAVDINAALPPPNISISAISSSDPSASTGADKLSLSLRQLALAAVEEGFEELLDRAKQRINAILTDALSEAKVRAQDTLGLLIENAFEQLQDRADSFLAGKQTAWEQAAVTMDEKATEQLRVRAAEFETQLAAATERARRDLGQVLVDLGSRLS